jgi:hypothetical protein
MYKMVSSAYMHVDPFWLACLIGSKVVRDQHALEDFIHKFEFFLMKKGTDNGQSPF